MAMNRRRFLSFWACGDFGTGRPGKTLAPSFAAKTVLPLYWVLCIGSAKSRQRAILGENRLSAGLKVVAGTR
jgi:hypothetical protein